MPYRLRFSRLLRKFVGEDALRVADALHEPAEEQGGLFVIVSNLITVFKYLMLQFLPAAFAGLGDTAFGWPGIPVTLFGETFEWNILGYDQAHGGLAYFCAYMVAMVIGECINFPIQRSFPVRFPPKGM